MLIRGGENLHRVLLISLTLILLASCGERGVDQVEDFSGKESDEENQMKLINHDKELESEEGENLQLPDSYPNDLPIMEGAEIVKYSTIETKSKSNNYIVVYEAEQSIGEVSTFIRSYAEKRNWKLEEVKKNDEMLALDLFVENKNTVFELIQVDASVIKKGKVIVSLNIIAERKTNKY